MFGTILTEAGKVLAQYVLEAEALLGRGAERLRAFTELGIGTLVIAASGTPGTYLLPKVLADFRQRHPGVEISTVFGTSAEAVRAVRSHHAELGVVGTASAAPELIVLPLVQDEIVLVGPPSLAGQELSPRDLQQYTWICREEGSATRALVDAECRDLGIKPQARLELYSWEAIKLSVAHRAGIAACSRFAVQAELRTGTIIELKVPFWRLYRMISVILHTGFPLTQAAELFLAMLFSHWESRSE